MTCTNFRHFFSFSTSGKNFIEPLDQTNADRGTAFGGGGDPDGQVCPRARNWHGRDDGSIIVRTVRLPPGHYEYYLASYCYNATHAADRRTGSYAFEPTFLLKRSRFEKERLK